jgi:hypothetical protein
MLSWEVLVVGCGREFFYVSHKALKYIYNASSHCFKWIILNLSDYSEHYNSRSCMILTTNSRILMVEPKGSTSLITKSALWKRSWDTFFFPVALQSLKDLGRLTYMRFLELFRHMVGLLGRVISPSQGPYLHRTTQHKKTQTNIHALSGIRTHDPRKQPAKNHASDRTATVTGMSYSYPSHILTNPHKFPNAEVVSRHLLNFPNAYFSRGFPTKLLYAFLVSPHTPIETT